MANKIGDASRPSALADLIRTGLAKHRWPVESLASDQPAGKFPAAAQGG